MPNTQAPILEVSDLEVEFAVDDGKIKVLDGVSFKVAPGQTLGIVGESGCGKSVTSLAIMGLLPKPHGQVVAGSIRFQGEELLTLAPDQMYKVRGNRISMIFQEPMTALNPQKSVGWQIDEVLKLHTKLSRAERKARTLEILRDVHIPDPASTYNAYPHQISGGQRQRTALARALVTRPQALLLDEPFAALDHALRAHLRRELEGVLEETGIPLLLISHDPEDVALFGQQVVHMADGRMQA